jgi:hypothetical protein
MKEIIIPDINLQSGEKQTATSEVKKFEATLEKIWFVINEKSPRNWLKEVSQLLQEEKEKATQNPVLNNFWTQHIDQVESLIKESANITEIDAEDFEEKISLRTQSLLTEIRSHIEFAFDTEKIKMLKKSWDQILQSSNKNYKLLQESNKGKTTLLVTNSEGKQYKFPIPSVNNLAHKGGVCRLLLKIINNAPKELIDAELPLNDYDVVGVVENKEVRENAISLGLTEEGIEPAAHELNFSELAAGRDLDINQVFLTKDGLIFSEAAQRAAVSGEINIPAQDRGTYNNNLIPIENGCLVSDWGMFRLLKFVTEGKAKSFSFTPLNKQIDMGAYLLRLVGKFSKKSNNHELIEKMFYLAKQMGQVRDDEQSIFDFLKRLSLKYGKIPNKESSHEYKQINFARWFTIRNLRSINRAFLEQSGIRQKLPLKRQPNDMTPYDVSLDGFAYTMTPSEFENSWQRINGI